MPPQVSPARHRLEPGEHPHEGWAAVDFGTTNTAVTLFDQYGLDLRTMSAEQEEELRKELAALLTREPSAEEARLGWQRLMADSARRLLGQPGPDGSPAQALSWALTSGSPPLSPHALYTELEARLPGSTVATRRYAAACLPGPSAQAWFP